MLLIVVLLLSVACGSASRDYTENAAATTTVQDRATTETSDQKVFFPKQKPAANEMLSASYGTSGKLVIDDRNCLRLEARNASYVPLWPSNFDLNTTGEDVHVADGEGKVVGRVGGRVSAGGNGVGDSLKGLKSVSKQLQRKLPERCPGPYWIVGPPVHPSTTGG